MSVIFKQRLHGLGTVLALLLSVAPAFAQSPLALTANKWTAGGQLALPVTFERPSSWTWSLELEPRAGYFAWKNLELVSKLGLSTRLASSQVNVVPQGVIWGVSLGAQYYFDTPLLLHPYVGLLLGFGMENTVLFSSRITFDVPLGVLIAVSDWCAIDVGVPVKWEVSIRSFFEKLSISPGYLGVRLFF